MQIINHSKSLLCRILIPNKGRLVSIKGKMAQCIAHASEVAIPNPSQFILKFMEGKDKIFAIMLQVLTCYLGNNFIPSHFGCKFANDYAKEEEHMVGIHSFFCLVTGCFLPGPVQ